VLRLSRFASCAVAFLAAYGCGAATGSRLPGPAPTVAQRDLVVTSDEGGVCVVSALVPPPCVPVLASGEPVASAVLARLDATADVVMVLARPEVVVAQLGPGPPLIPVRLGGRDLFVWLRTVPAGTAVICVSYRAADGEGRLIVHHALTVARTEVAAIKPEPDDGC
jgi:hypothetical protein